MNAEVLTMRRFFWCTRKKRNKNKKKQVFSSSGLSLEVEEAMAVDNCPERMDAADAEAPRPSRIETAVEF